MPVLHPMACIERLEVCEWGLALPEAVFADGSIITDFMETKDESASELSKELINIVTTRKLWKLRSPR